MSDPVQQPIRRVTHLETWLATTRLGSQNSFQAGASRAEGTTTDMVLRPGLGVEIHYTPRGRPPVLAIIPFNAIRILTLEPEATASGPEESAP